MQPVFIISPETAGMDSVEVVAMHKAMTHLFDNWKLPYKQVIGVYEGYEEGSYVVVADEKDMDKIATLRDMFNQECFMYVDSRRYASLHYNKHVKYLGRLIDASPDIAKKRDAYTTDGATYWIVE